MVLFRDNVEPDLTRWTGTRGYNGGTVPAIVTTPTRNGAHSAHLVCAANSQGSYMWKTITSSLDVYCREWVRFHSTGGGEGPVLIWFTNGGDPNAAGTSLAYLKIFNINSTSSYLDIENVIGGGSYTSADFTTILERWYCFEFRMKVDAAAGILQGFLEGNRLMDQRALNTGATSIDTALCGIGWAWEAEDLYADSFVVDISYIGPDPIFSLKSGPYIQSDLFWRRTLKRAF